MEPPPNPIFLDTSYIQAVLNTRDQWHEAAAQWEQRLRTRSLRLLTTEFVLVEVADGLAAARFRSVAVQAIASLQTNPLVEIIAVSPQLLDDGLALYRRRPDKDWGLTDCISFVVMTDYELTEALTADAHFRQAGFRALLLEDPPQ